MPTNKALTDEANALAAELGSEVETAGLSNRELQDLVNDLRARKGDSELATETDATFAEGELQAEAEPTSQEQEPAAAEPTGEAEAEQPEAEGTDAAEPGAAEPAAAEPAEPEVTEPVSEVPRAEEGSCAQDETGGELVIAPDMSLTSLRGVLGPGTVVTENDFHGGKEVIDRLLKTGALHKGKPQS